MSLRWLTVFLDFPAGSFDAGTAFWQTVTGSGLSPARGADGGFVFCLVKWDSERAVPPPLPAADGATGASRADTLCLDVPPEEFDREVAFWTALTGQESRPAPVPGYAYLTRAPGWPIQLLLQRRDAAAPSDRTRAHVDFGCTDAGARARHVAHGARVADVQPYWTVLTDPAGRVYCLVNRDPR